MKRPSPDFDARRCQLAHCQRIPEIERPRTSLPRAHAALRNCGMLLRTCSSLLAESSTRGGSRWKFERCCRTTRRRLRTGNGESTCSINAIGAVSMLGTHDALRRSVFAALDFGDSPDLLTTRRSRRQNDARGTRQAGGRRQSGLPERTVRMAEALRSGPARDRQRRGKIQIQQAAKADARGDEQYNQYQSTFRPIEETMAQEAMDYGIGGRSGARRQGCRLYRLAELREHQASAKRPAKWASIQTPV